MQTSTLIGAALLFTSMSAAIAQDGPVWKDKAVLEQLKQAAQIKGCNPIYYRGTIISIGDYIRKPGVYCAIHDFSQRKIWSVIDGQQRGNPGADGILMFSQTHHADLDLAGHLISGEPFENMIGVTTERYIKKGNNIFLTVRNGRIVTPGVWSTAVEMAPYAYGSSVEFASRPELQKPEKEDRAPIRSEGLSEDQKFSWDYLPETHYTLDSLTIESGGRGVILSGAYNAVRNSTIEVDSKVAMVSYGPNLVVENNTFIIHGGEDVYTAPATQAILKLRDADNAVIRNNRFIAKGLFVSCPAAINLINSRNVLIEKNTVEGCEALLRKDEVSSASDKGNALK